MTIYPSSLRPRPCRRRGFTFAEVLFAVILLGIGFIMLAGMFPVAITQTQASMSETAAANYAQAAAKIIEQSGAHIDFDATGHRFQPLRVWDATKNPILPAGYLDLWDRVKYDAISDQDPRFAWSALFRRSSGSERVAQLIIFVSQVREKGTYAPEDADADATGTTWFEPYQNNGAPQPGTFEPKAVYAVISDGTRETGGTDIIEFYEPPGSQYNARDFVAEGCFVVVADDRWTDASGKFGWPSEGSVYRVGARREDRDGTNSPSGVGGGRGFAYELVPGFDLTDGRENLPPPSNPNNPSGQYGDHQNTPAAICYIVGKGWVNGTDSSSNGAATYRKVPDQLGGKAQDIAVYTTFITIK